MHAFVTASHNWGQINFNSYWKPQRVQGLIPVFSRDSVSDKNELGIPFIQRIMSKFRFYKLVRALRYSDESGLVDKQMKNNAKDSFFWSFKKFVETLREKYKEMYMLRQKVDIDEQFITWKG